MRPKHPWITALLAVLAAVLAFGGLGALLEAAKDDSALKPPPAVEKAKPPAGVEEPEPPASPPPKPAPADQEPPPGAVPEQGTSAVPPPGRPTVPAPRGPVVERVIDGDTIEVRGDGRIIPVGTEARVRLLQIDAPEQGDCFSDEATARTEQLLPPGSRVRAEVDEDLKDRYGRYLLYVWNEQGVFVNESLVRDGYAKAVLYEPNDKYWPEISRAQSTARQADEGLWSACAATPAAPPPSPAQPARPAEPEGAGLPAGPPPGPDLDCADVAGPVWVGAADPHRLDRDGDGIGCE
ncbi:thermonuclease family protein [Streptomyces lavendulocolor]|uniref:Thermonuclease family protein n=1 Tax=Streptomyces lavendulocolor TaxID=67316 RepID=A0ABV2W8Y7_9ACTN